MFLRLRGRVAVAIAFAVPLVGLLATVRTSVGFWDTGDLQTVAWIAGIPYPTGFPLYVIAGWIWTHALPLAPVAARLNALSAVAIAGGAAAVCAIAILCDVAVVLAVVSGWAFAFAFPVWLRATYADVHPLGFAAAFVAIAFAVRWVRRARVRDLVAAMLIASTALAFDNTSVLILAGGVVVALERPPPFAVAARAALAGALIVCAAYAFLPLRSAQVSAARLDPTLALGIPAGRPFWDDHHPASFEGFVALVGGTAFSPGRSLAGIASPVVISGAAARYVPLLSADFPAGLALLGPLGLVLRSRRRPLLALGLTLAAAVPALFASSYPAEADPERYVFALYAVCALGLAFTFDEAAGLLAGRARGFALAGAAALLLAVVGHELTRGAPLLDVRADASAAAVTDEVMRLTNDRAIIVTPWLYATPFAYRAYVENAFGARIVVCGFVTDYSALYAGWLRTRPVVVVSNDTPVVPGLRVRELRGGRPAVFELLP